MNFIVLPQAADEFEGAVIEHMEKHGGSWPRSWDELRTTSDQAYKGATSTNRDGTWIAEFRPRDTIDELKQRVDIDPLIGRRIRRHSRRRSSKQTAHRR